MKEVKLVHQIVISSEPNAHHKTNNFDSIRAYLPNHKYMMWNAERISSLMASRGDLEVHRAFNDIKAFAFKADIARYYILNLMGGWYIDSNISLKSSLPSMENVDLAFFTDLGAQEFGCTFAIANGFLYSSPNQQVMSDALAHSTKNVSSKYYGTHPLMVTSTPILGLAIAKHFFDRKEKPLIGEFTKTADVPGFYLNDELIATYKENGLKHAESGIAGGNNYEDIWFAEALY